MKVLRWEYKLFGTNSNIKHSEFESKCNAKGSEGWEFCAAVILETKVYYLFKRPCGYVE